MGRFRRTALCPRPATHASPTASKHGWPSFPPFLEGDFGSLSAAHRSFFPLHASSHVTLYNLALLYKKQFTLHYSHLRGSLQTLLSSDTNSSIIHILRNLQNPLRDSGTHTPHFFHSHVLSPEPKTTASIVFRLLLPPQGCSKKLFYFSFNGIHPMAARSRISNEPFRSRALHAVYKYFGALSSRYAVTVKCQEFLSVSLTHQSLNALTASFFLLCSHWFLKHLCKA